VSLAAKEPRMRPVFALAAPANVADRENADSNCIVTCCLPPAWQRWVSCCVLEYLHVVVALKHGKVTSTEERFVVCRCRVMQCAVTGKYSISCWVWEWLERYLCSLCTPSWRVRVLKKCCVIISKGGISAMGLCVNVPICRKDVPCGREA